MLEERFLRGEDVSDDLKKLIKNYDQAKKHAEDLLMDLEKRKRALKIRSINLPVKYTP